MQSPALRAVWQPSLMDEHDIGCTSRSRAVKNPSLSGQQLRDSRPAEGFLEYIERVHLFQYVHVAPMPKFGLRFT